MDNNNLKEKNFEEDVERWLLDEGGYERGFQMTYNKDEAIDLTALIDFITETQPKEWAHYQKIYGVENASGLFYKVLPDIVNTYPKKSSSNKCDPLMPFHEHGSSDGLFILRQGHLYCYNSPGKFEHLVHTHVRYGKCWPRNCIERSLQTEGIFLQSCLIPCLMTESSSYMELRPT